MRVILAGADGRMGREVRWLLSQEEGMILAAGVDPRSEGGAFCRSFSEVDEEGDVLLDFSCHDGTRELLKFALLHRLPTVIAVTGHTAEERQYIESTSRQIPIFLSANLSLGTAVLTEAVKLAVSVFPKVEVEIAETHHREKIDAPSGTALMLAEAVCRERKTIVCGRYGHRKKSADDIGIHSFRYGSGAGEHTVILSAGQETLVFTHRAESPALFAEGAIAAMRYIVSREAGLYGMQDLLRERRKT